MLIRHTLQFFVLYCVYTSLLAIPTYTDAVCSHLTYVLSLHSHLMDTHTHTVSGTISTDFNTELRTCDCFSPSAVREGKELRIFYGARSNAELFLHQGFVYPPNTGDTLRIKLGEWVGSLLCLCAD